MRATISSGLLARHGTAAALYAARRRGWVDEDDFRLMHFKIHQMLQRTFLPLDADHGGWANYYDSHGGAPLKYLAYWERRHSFERFAPGEPLELWGVPTRTPFTTTTRITGMRPRPWWTNSCAWRPRGLEGDRQSGFPGGRRPGRRRAALRPALVPRADGARTIELAPGSAWRARRRGRLHRRQPFLAPGRGGVRSLHGHRMGMAMRLDAPTAATRTGSFRAAAYHTKECGTCGGPATALTTPNLGFLRLETERICCHLWISAALP